MPTLLIDAAPLGDIVHSNAARRNPRLKWLAELAEQGIKVRVPASADYEVRRKMIHLHRTHKDPVQRTTWGESIKRLDALIQASGCLDLTEVIMQDAADLWATAKVRNLQTAADHDINWDVVICAVARTEDGGNCVIATENVGHLGRFATAKVWSNITIADF